MDRYPENFAVLVRDMAQEACAFGAAELQDDTDVAEMSVQRMEDCRVALEEEGVLESDACVQIKDMALCAVRLILSDLVDPEVRGDRQQEFSDACEPCPGNVDGKLWNRTRQLFIANAAFMCAEASGDEGAAEKHRRKFDKLSRAIAGFKPIGNEATTRDADEFAARAKEAIPATVVMFSGCMDSQTSADVFNTDSFALPTDAGPGGAGGACTTSMIKALSESENYSWVGLLKEMRSILAGTYTQIPMLSSSRAMDLNGQFSVLHSEASGRTRALLVGINYMGSTSELRGCHNDVHKMCTYLNKNGYADDCMRLLLDDGEHDEPTRANIIRGFEWLVEGAQAGDSLFFHYSGHGTSVRDDGDDEEDGKDECLVPVDFQAAGLLRDDDTFKHLVAPLQEGALLTCVLDCCHSGTILDLPYVFKADEEGLDAVESGQVNNLMPNADFDLGKMLQCIKDHPALAAGGAAITGLAYFTGGRQRASLVGMEVAKVLSAEDKKAACLGAAQSLFGQFFGR
mmetsp:Transcript_118465/g.295595  ORF Transcript_118465/g.295595 Transcript_118465/m.295595 type:complete len:514 (+) Transcript_118465:56-1597(+)